MIGAVVLKEAIGQGQRLEEVVVEGRTDGGWRELARTGCIGYQRIVPVAPSDAVDAVRFTVTRTRATPVLAAAAVLSA